MAAIFKFLFVLLAIFAVASAWPAVETTEEDTKVVEAASKLSSAVEEAHGNHESAALGANEEEKTRQKRGCTKIGFTSRSGRKVEAGRGC